MARHTDVVLDGTTYRVPTLTNDQLERVMDAMTDEKMAAHKRAFVVLPIMLEDATPTIPRTEDGKLKFRLSSDEMGAAIKAIMEATGVQTSAANPPALAVVPRTAAE
jgi:hypothetical protein